MFAKSWYMSSSGLNSLPINFCIFVLNAMANVIIDIESIVIIE